MEGVKVPNSLLVSGLTGTEADEEVYDFLKEYGSIQRTIPVDLSQSELGLQVIVEYTHGAGVQALSSSLPYELTSKALKDTTYQIKALASIYAPAVSQSATEVYLTELKEIAKQSGKDFADVLSAELSRISERVGQDDPESREETTDLIDDVQGHVSGTPAQVSPQPSALSPQHVHIPELDPAPSQQPHIEKTQPTLNLTDLYPSDLQKVVIEHIVKHEDSATQAHASLRLRPFSGRSPRPNNEIDYETWRSNADFLLRDTQQSDLFKSRKILDSLLSPAADIVKHLTPNSSPSMYLDILDSAYGTVVDGDNLYAKFLNTLQNYGEKSSAYLQRLQVMLSTTFRRGGVSATDLDSQLLKQFCRGRWNNTLISELKLEQKKQNPPTFAELLLLLRTEEDKRDSKACRMKQYFGASKQKVSSHFQGACAQCAEECTTSAHEHNETKLEIQSLKKQIAHLQSHLQRITQKGNKSHSKKTPPRNVTIKPSAENAQQMQPNSHNADNHPRNKPRPWYCFRCGEDGHIKPQCEADPNPSLVASKRKLLKEKQMEWEEKNGLSQSAPLN